MFTEGPAGLCASCASRRGTNGSFTFNLTRYIQLPKGNLKSF